MVTIITAVCWESSDLQLFMLEPELELSLNVQVDIRLCRPQPRAALQTAVFDPENQLSTRG